MRRSFSSSNSASKYVREKTIQPLSGSFFSQLIKLETDFNNKNYTAETLDELTQFYAQAVEYYDSIKDQISSYFIFKIQDTLATKKSLKLLMQESVRASMLASSTDLKETRDLLVDPQGVSETAEAVNGAAISNNGDALGVSGSKMKNGLTEDLGAQLIMEAMEGESSEDEDDDDEDKEISMIERTRKAEEMKRRKDPKSLASMKSKKQRMFTLQMKIQNEKVNEKESLKVVLSSFNGSSQDNDRVVKDNIIEQKKRIKQKIARRQKDSLVNYTHSSTGFLAGRIDNLEGPTMESVLKALDYEDSVQSKENEESICSTNNENALELNRESQSESL